MSTSQLFSTTLLRVLFVTGPFLQVEGPYIFSGGRSSQTRSRTSPRGPAGSPRET